MSNKSTESDNCKLFAYYAGDDLEKWKTIIGQDIVDAEYGKGVIKDAYRGGNGVIVLVISFTDTVVEETILASLIRDFCECSLPPTFQADDLPLEKYKQMKKKLSLKCIEAKIRSNMELNDSEIKYLEDQGEHSLLAQYYESRFKVTNDCWYIPQASKRWRAARQPQQVIERDLKHINDPGCKAAILTSRGAAFADLGRLHEAEQCGLEAERLKPDSCHAIHLLERVYSLMEETEKLEGYKIKAENLGCPPPEQWS